jgi:ubiquinone/menaquinone biosynthesis C-methylase UbiE
MYDGPQNRDEFIRNGEAYFAHFKDLLSLAPDEAVLDVGSGMGRKTRLLTQYLVPPGRYVGLDIVQSGVAWCTQHITSRYPNFTFEHIDVQNGMYNPNGKYTATNYQFPFEDATFDVAILGSVFTHMKPPEVDHYLAELARVLRPGARTMITYFLLNDESERLIAQGHTAFSFRHQYEGYAVEVAHAPENAVALPEHDVREFYQRHQLVIDEPIRYGSWAARESYLDFQDIVIAHKPR